MNINYDDKSVLINIKAYKKLLAMAEVAIGEMQYCRGDVNTVTKHARRFNPYIQIEHNEEQARLDEQRRADRARLKALFKSGGKRIFYKEDNKTYYPVKLISHMKGDWTMLHMVSATEGHKFSSYQKIQHLDNFVIEGELPLYPDPTMMGVWRRRLTLAESDAEWNKHHAVPEPQFYNLRVTYGRGDVSVQKEFLDGSLFTNQESQPELIKFQQRCNKELHSCLIDDYYVAELHSIADDLFGKGRDSYFNELIIDKQSV